MKKNRLRACASALALLLPVLSASAQEIPPSGPGGTSGLAAFDPVWLEAYYAPADSVLSARGPANPSAAAGPAAVQPSSVGSSARTGDGPVSGSVREPRPSGRSSGWYIGINGGVPFGVSAYSSFGQDKTRAGWSAGVYGGYRFSPVLSLEVQAAWGQTNLTSRGCCPDYWLGSDGVLYEAAVAGMDGRNWNSLESRVFLQRYGLQFNINLLGIFGGTRDGRWTLEVSPLLAAYGTKATFRTLDGGPAAAPDGASIPDDTPSGSVSSGAAVSAGLTRWHFGAGVTVQAGYAVTRNLAIGLYTGLTWLSGDPLDGTPEHLHKANWIWESGLKLGWRFGKQGKEGSK